ncbi:MAG: CZB domain-containing protein [Mariprofundales bacterium]
MQKINLNNIIERLNKARVAHLRWVARAEGLVEGLPLAKEQVPVLSTDCDFGTWYHGEGIVLRSLTSYTALDPKHQALHKTYMQIFKLLYGEDDRSALGKMFGSSKLYKKQQVEKAAILIPKLQMESRTLLDGLDLLEREVIIKYKISTVQ